jgi:hypothetical protein
MTTLRFGTDTGSGHGMGPRMGGFGHRSIVTDCDIPAEVIFVFGRGWRDRRCWFAGIGWRWERKRMRSGTSWRFVGTLRSCRQAFWFDTLGCRATSRHRCSSERRWLGEAEAREGRASAQPVSGKASEGTKARRASALPRHLAVSGEERTLGRSKALKSGAQRLFRGNSERSDTEPGSA